VKRKAAHPSHKVRDGMASFLRAGPPGAHSLLPKRCQRLPESLLLGGRCLQAVESGVELSEPVIFASDKPEHGRVSEDFLRIVVETESAIFPRFFVLEAFDQCVEVPAAGGQ